MARFGSSCLQRGKGIWEKRCRQDGMGIWEGRCLQRGRGIQGIWRQPGRKLLLGSRGQMAVEMAVVLPILLAVAGIAINLMVYLGDCARFDRVAAEAVRIQAASPGYSNYSSTSRAQEVQKQIELAFATSDHLTITVTVHEGTTDGSTDGDRVTLSLVPRLETYTCTLSYRPWGFGKSFFGIEFSGISHTRQYVIDPYRPGVFF